MLFRNSIFLGGRYCKYSRNLPQTPWILQVSDTQVHTNLQWGSGSGSRTKYFKFLSNIHKKYFWAELPVVFSWTSNKGFKFPEYEYRVSKLFKLKRRIYLLLGRVRRHFDSPGSRSETKFEIYFKLS